MKKFLLFVFCAILMTAGGAQASEDPTKTPACRTAHGPQSYFDRDYNDCRCLTGYKLNATGRCDEMPTTISCMKDYGDFAQYNAVSNLCECKLEYYFNRKTGQCEPANALCRAVFGEHSYLNFVNNHCQCESGYVLGVGNICVEQQKLKWSSDDVINYTTKIDTSTPPTADVAPVMSNTSSNTLPSTAPVAQYTFTRDLKTGDKGTDVEELQKFLIAHNFLTTSSKLGTFGAATKAAVRKFQIAHGIRVTGNVGPLTRDVLNAQ